MYLESMVNCLVLNVLKVTYDTLGNTLAVKMGKEVDMMEIWRSV